MNRIYIIETSYLLELYRVPGFSTDQHYMHILGKIKEAADSNSLLFVTLPCIVEVANHIADSPNKHIAYDIGRNLLADVTASIETQTPWQITPSYNSVDAFRAALSFFLSDLLLSGVGLCDAFTIKEAERLASKYAGNNYQVHILTLDAGLKAREPHPEPNPYVGAV